MPFTIPGPKDASSTGYTTGQSLLDVAESISEALSDIGVEDNSTALSTYYPHCYRIEITITEI